MTETSSSKKYVFNASWILIEKLSRIISGLLVGVLVARYLGPSQFGSISYALNVVAIFTVFSTLGMDNIIIRELLTDNERKQIILGTGFILRLIGAIFVVIAATSYSYIRDSGDLVFLVFLISLSIISQSLTVIDFYFQSEAKGKFIAINQIITLLISSVVKIIFIIIQAPVEYFASMVLFEATITAFNQFYFYKKYGENLFTWKFSFAEVKQLLKYSWPIIISGLIMMVYQKMDQILIKRFLDLNSVGNYAAAIRMSEASFFIPVSICAAVFPGIISTRSNKELQTQRLTQLYSLLIWSAIIISIVGTLFGDWIIQVIYKQTYSMSAAVFKIHIWVTIPVFFGTAWGAWIISENKQRYVIFMNIASLILCYIFNVTLIPKLGINGAAYSILITYYLGFIVVLLSYRSRYTITLFMKALNPKNLWDIYEYYKPRK